VGYLNYIELTYRQLMSWSCGWCKKMISYWHGILSTLSTLSPHTHSHTLSLSTAVTTLLNNVSVSSAWVRRSLFQCFWLIPSSVMINIIVSSFMVLHNARSTSMFRFLFFLTNSSSSLVLIVMEVTARSRLISSFYFFWGSWSNCSRRVNANSSLRVQPGLLRLTRIMLVLCYNTNNKGSEC